jgi:Calcineurin-like phosphoesterase
MSDTRRICVFGDLHGVLDSFKEFLDKINYTPDKIRLVSLGDLVHRGPQSYELVQFIRKLGIEVVKGNHDDYEVRWRAHQKNEKLTGKKNPMPRKEDGRHDEHEKFSDDDIAWMAALPYKIHLKDNWWGVHAGCESRFSLKDQDPKILLRCRYLNEKGKMVAIKKDRSQPKGTKFWTEMWRGENILYGHSVHSLTDVRIDKHKGTTCYGLDSGLVYGGHLSAIFLDTMEIVQVKGRFAYKEKDID